jgi:prepilin-type processing-associated H-X9-DG protein
LVVIAVVSILAAILFPVFGRARENARRSTCQSNLKQMGLAFLQYVQDYDEAYPLTSYRASGEVNDSWTMTASPYLKSTQIFHCPSDASKVWETPASPPANNYYTTSYLMNAYMGGKNVWAKQSAIQSTAKVVLLTEAATDSTLRDHFHPFNWVTEVPANPLYSGYMHGVTWDDSANRTKEIALTRHLDGFNVAYCDGHVKWTRWTMVWPPKAGEPFEGVFDPRQ